MNIIYTDYGIIDNEYAAMEELMLQIGICDDETLLLDEIKKITDDCLQKQQTFSVLSTYTDGKNTSL